MNEEIQSIQHAFSFSALAQKYCTGKGLEIGGAAHNPFGLDTLNVDFCGSMDTIYKLEEVRICGKAMPIDIVAFGDNIPLPDESQDFVVSSHVLEHFPNPIKALKEWYRLVKQGGIIFMIVPHKERTFDSVQPRTTLMHLVQDYYNNGTQFHQNPQGHDHCWITEDILEMVNWMTSHLNMRWKVVEAHDVDDKVGNGFMIVLKKDNVFLIPAVNKPLISESTTKTILLVVHNFPPTAYGGVEVYTHNLAREMVAMGQQVTVLYPVTGPTATPYSFTAESVDGFCLVKFHVKPGGWDDGIFNRDIDIAFDRFLRSRTFDQVHFHHVSNNLSLSMISVAKKLDLPVAITLHDFWFICPRAQLYVEYNSSVCSGPESPTKCANCLFVAAWYPGNSHADFEQAIAVRQAYARKLLLEADLLFAPSRFVADVFERHGFGGNKIVVAPIGIGKFDVQRSTSGSGPRFGYMGTIHPVKNVFRLIEAFSATYGQARLDMYGGGETFRVNELKENIHDPRIVYHGSYTPDLLPEILSRIDVLVVPSLIESYCLTVREALSAGIPVLAARVGGIPEIVRNGVNGMLFDPVDQEGLTRLLQQFISNRCILQALNGKAFPVVPIADDASFLLEQYASRVKSRDLHQPGQEVDAKVLSSGTLTSISHNTPARCATNAPQAMVNKPLVIAVFTLDTQNSACPILRLISPMCSLGNSAKLFWGATYDGDVCTTNLHAISIADIIVLQRFYPRNGTLSNIEQMIASGKPIIYEIDDLITALPDDNPLKPSVEETTDLLKQLMPHFSAITTSTDVLANEFKCFNKKTYVLPNLIDESLWKLPTKNDNSGPIIIGFAGTNSHGADMDSIGDALFMIAQKYGKQVAFRFMGDASPKMAKLPGFSFVPFSSDYISYSRSLAQAGFDIAVVPLMDNTFNRCKSNIKWLEYSACGVAGIYADLPPYNSCIEQGVTGLLSGSDVQQWFNAIDLLISNPELRRSIALNAHQKVMAEYNLKTGAHRWLETYRDIIAQHNTGKSEPAISIDSPSNIVSNATCTSNKVSIIIPLYNQSELTKRCLETLKANTPQNLYELILVDNGSSYATKALLTSLPASVKIIRNQTNQGFARACNQGAQAANGKYLLFLNNDTEPHPEWLEALIEVLDDDATVAAVGSKLLYPDGTIQHAGVSIIDNLRDNDPLRGEHIWKGRPAEQPEVNQLYCYQALTAACLLIRREAFEAVEGFDEGYWNGYEDVDLCFKLGQKGWKLVYQPASVVIHHESKSGEERFAGVSRNIQRLHEKWLGKIQPDIIIHADGRVEEGAGISSGCMAPYVLKAVVPAPIVSIIIPLFNQAHLTKACVEAIHATAGAPVRYELILVDNGSRDWTPEYLRSLGNSVVVITNGDNPGFAKACNQAARIARGEYLLLLNNDTVPQSGWLDALLAGVREERADIVGAKLLYSNGKVQHAGVAFNRNGIGYHIFKNFDGNSPAVNQKRFLQCVTAACMLVSRQFFNELGGFDEQFRNGFEDVDFCLRAGQAGKRILYTPDAVVIHHEEQSEGRKRHDHENMKLYLSRWQGRVRCDDEELYAAHNLCVEWRKDGSCTLRQLRNTPETTATISRYPLIPLVGAYAETPLARLSGSSRMKAVLNKYTAVQPQLP